jgi:hypothetical protein
MMHGGVGTAAVLCSAAAVAAAAGAVGGLVWGASAGARLGFVHEGLILCKSDSSNFPA